MFNSKLSLVFGNCDGHLSQFSSACGPKSRQYLADYSTYLIKNLVQMLVKPEIKVIWHTFDTHNQACEIVCFCRPSYISLTSILIYIYIMWSSSISYCIIQYFISFILQHGKNYNQVPMCELLFQLTLMYIFLWKFAVASNHSHIFHSYSHGGRK